MNWSSFTAGAVLLLILVFIPLVRQSIRQRNANNASAPAATAGGTPGAGAAAPAPAAAASTTTTATPSPAPTNKWSGWVKNGALMVVGGLVLWLIIIGPADWMGDVARFNWATSTALGAWLAGTVGASLANLIMWGLLGAAILLAFLAWTGTHKGVTKTISSIPFTTLATLAVVGYIAITLVSGLTNWLNSPTPIRHVGVHDQARGVLEPITLQPGERSVTIPNWQGSCLRVSPAVGPMPVVESSFDRGSTFAIGMPNGSTDIRLCNQTPQVIVVSVSRQRAGSCGGSYIPPPNPGSC